MDESSDILESSSTVNRDTSPKILDISHPELVFQYYENKKTQVTERVVALSNLIDHKVLFKIKTTAPRKYTIKPSFGHIIPKGQIEVTISRASELISDLIVDKFQIQTIVLNESEYDILESSSREEIWNRVSRRDRITKHRITAKCAIINESSAPQNDGNVDIKQRIVPTQKLESTKPTSISVETPKTILKVEGSRKVKNYLITLIAILIIAFLSLLFLRVAF